MLFQILQSRSAILAQRLPGLNRDIWQIVITMQGVIQAVPGIVNAGGQVNDGFIVLFHLILLRLYKYA
jgi:hypothetical protein